MEQLQNIETARATLDEAISAAISGRDKLQAVLVFACHYVMQVDNLTFITEVLNKIDSVKAYRTATALAYIKAAVGNIKVTQDKETRAFNIVKLKKGADNPFTLDEEVLEHPWYLFNNDGLAKPDMDLIQRLKGMITGIEAAYDNALSEEPDDSKAKLKGSQVPKAEDVLQQLRSALTALEA